MIRRRFSSTNLENKPSLTPKNYIEIKFQHQNMKKLLLFLALSFCFSFSSYAQFGGFGMGGGKKIKGKITGSVIDSVSGEPVAYATLVLKNAGMSREKDGILTEDNGKFKFGEVKTGKYDVYVSFLGYNDKLLEDIELTLKNPDKDLGKIQLVPANYVLDAVEISETRSLIENKVDKLVYNVEQDASLAGGDAADALRKVPLLTVDLEGNVSLRGSRNVRILINGKPSGMFSNNVADALKMFPADQIKKVEVITSPSAKYDGEGSSGIINIITKKGNIEGVAGTVNLSLGNRQNTGSLNLNAGKGRFGFSSNGGVFYSVPADATQSMNRQSYTDAGISSYTYDGINNTGRLGFNGTASAFYDVNAFNAFNTSISYQGFGFDMDGDLSGVIAAAGGTPNEFTRELEMNNLFSGYDWSSDYTRTFEEDKDRELVLGYQLSGNIQNQENFTNETYTFDTENVLTRRADIFNDGDNLESTIQIDYTHPLPKSYKLETGAKAVLRDIKSDYYTENDGTQVPALSNLFEYNQDVYAGYASLSWIWAKKYSFIAGVRYERTQIDGSYRDDLPGFENGYENWLPSFTVSRNLKNFRSIKLSYTRRIQRPSLFYINPFNNNTDVLNQVIGNPNLSPELVDQIELSHNTNLAGFTVFGSAYYKRTTDIIETIVSVDNGVSTNSFFNIGENNAFGLNLFTTKSINNFTLRGGGNIYTYDAQGIVNGETLSRQTYEYNLFASGEYTITGDFKADFFGFFKSPSRSLTGDQPAFSIWGFGLRRDYGAWSFGLRVIEPFEANKEFNSDNKITDDNGQLSAVGQYTQQTGFSIPFRSLGVSLKYKFGKVDFKQRRSKVKNDDLKQGQGGGGQGQGGGSGGGGGFGG